MLYNILKVSRNLMGGDYKKLTATECIFSGQFMYIMYACMDPNFQNKIPRIRNSFLNIILVKIIYIQ